jgi:RHS repeat-associated protein
LEVVYSTEATTRTVYFLKDHLGSIRATVLDSAGAPVIGYDDYDPWGYPLALRTKAIPNAYLQGASKNKFTGKEWDDEFGVNWLHFPYRSYDPEIGRWMVRDPLAMKYPNFSPYVYAANNPANVIDIDGDSTFVVANGNGTYTVTGGHLSGAEDDTGIYTRDADGNLVLVGQSITTHSFFDDEGNPVVGAVIDPESYEGFLFVLAEIIGGDPSLIGYVTNATENQKYDFKNRGVKEAKAKGVDPSQHHYRGSAVPFTGDIATFGSARDFGNIGAGIVAGRAGLSWGEARLGFDALQTIQERQISREGTPTQKAQRIGHAIGVRLRKVD